MIGVTPSRIAMLFLKINILLFVITLGANSLAIFPYYMHVTQIANLIALDVSNRNYIMEDEVFTYVNHFNKRIDEPGANTYSYLTFRNEDFRSYVTANALQNNAKYYAEKRGVTAFFTVIIQEPNSSALMGRESANVAVSVNVMDGPKTGKSLIQTKAGFDPLNKPADMVDGMNALGNRVLVNRGVPFKVTVQTRYKLTGGAFGFLFHSAIPMNVETIGVTTQYYQYDSN